MSDERGGSSVEILLDDVTAEEVTGLTEKLADLLVDAGLGTEEPVRSMIVVRGYAWPDTEEELIEECDGASMILFPCENVTDESDPLSKVGNDA